MSLANFVLLSKLFIVYNKYYVTSGHKTSWDDVMYTVYIGEGPELQLWNGKAMFILQEALPLNIKVYGNFWRGTEVKTRGKRGNDLTDLLVIYFYDLFAILYVSCLKVSDLSRVRKKDLYLWRWLWHICCTLLPVLISVGKLCQRQKLFPEE